MNPGINVGQAPTANTVTYDITGANFEPGAFLSFDPIVPGSTPFWTTADANGGIDVRGQYPRTPGAPAVFAASVYRIFPNTHPQVPPLFLFKTNVVTLTQP